MQLRIQACQRSQILGKKYIPVGSRNAIKRLRKKRRAAPAKRKAPEATETVETAETAEATETAETAAPAKIHEPERGFVAPTDPEVPVHSNGDADGEPAAKRARPDEA
jgi:hypothetical protein